MDGPISNSLLRFPEKFEADERRPLVTDHTILQKNLKDVNLIQITLKTLSKIL